MLKIVQNRMHIMTPVSCMNKLIDNIPHHQTVLINTRKNN